MKNITQPKILKGTRDFGPEQMSKRLFVMETMRKVFANFGYDTIETPVIEYAETILGKYGDEGNQLVYRFKDNGDRDIALRYDQTVPFARFVATNYYDLPMPFKRYQISRVWRADKPTKGRYREFYQCDIDIIGATNLLAEAEIAKVVYTAFKTLGFKKFNIKINSRRLINSILDSLNIPKEKQGRVMVTLDKLEKIGVENIEQELSSFIPEEITKQFLNLVLTKGNNQEKLNGLSQFDTTEIKTFLKLCKDFDIPEQFIDFDISLARGLNYYTGITYEVFIPKADIGAVCGGGRYDDLCGMFINESCSGVGVAFGFDRIVLAMESLGMLKNVELNSDVLITYFGEETLKKSIEIFNQLQKAGVNSEIYFEPAKIQKQFKYANKKQINFVIICGPKEAEQGTVTIKNMEDGKQKTIPQIQLGDYFNGYTNI